MIDTLLVVAACFSCFALGWSACAKATPATIEAAFTRGYRKGFVNGRTAGVADEQAQCRAEAAHNEGLDLAEPIIGIVRTNETVQ